jgi:MFS family permease
VDNPTRQAFVMEMVGKDELVNAVSLNSTEINLARVVGPAIAGILIASVGLAVCFLINGLSFLAVLAVLMAMRGEELRPTPLAPRVPGQLRQGLQYVRASPVIRTILVMMAIIGTFIYEFSVSLPLFAEVTFRQGPATYAAMTAAMGLGAVVGGLYTASQGIGSTQRLTVAALLFGATVLLTAVAPTLPLALLGLVAVGFCSIGFTSLGNATLQLTSSAEMRGRVMALWTVAFLGSTPIGGSGDRSDWGARGTAVGARPRRSSGSAGRWSRRRGLSSAIRGRRPHRDGCRDAESASRVMMVDAMASDSAVVTARGRGRSHGRCRARRERAISGEEKANRTRGAGGAGDWGRPPVSLIPN